MKILRCLALLLLCTSCGVGEQQEKNNRLHLSLRKKLRTLDPASGGEYPIPYVLTMLFDGLTRRNEEGKIAPSVAHSYALAEDGMSCIFYLRPSYWSDGVPVTAHDFEYGWKRCIDSKHASPGGRYFYSIRGARAAIEGQGSVDEVGIKALDDHTLRVDFEFPTPHFADLFALTYFYPVPRHSIEQGMSYSPSKSNAFVTNGPFKLESWEWDHGIKVTKSESYWDRDHVYLDGIEMDFIADDMINLFRFERGELDWIGPPMTPIAPHLMQELTDSRPLSKVETTRIYWIFINQDAYPFTNKKIRQAFSYAIDRKSIVDHLLEGLGRPANAVIAPCYQLNQPTYFKDGELEIARRLLKEGMEELGIDHFPKVTLHYPSSAHVIPYVVQALQGFWRSALGVQVILESSEWGVHFSTLQAGNYQLGIVGYFALACDPLYMLETFKYKRESMNMGNWESATYERLLDEAAQEKELSRRQELFIQAEAILMEEVAVLPLYFSTVAYRTNRGLTGFTMTASEDIDFKFASFSQ